MILDGDLRERLSAYWPHVEAVTLMERGENSEETFCRIERRRDDPVLSRWGDWSDNPTEQAELMALAVENELQAAMEPGATYRIGLWGSKSRALGRITVPTEGKLERRAGDQPLSAFAATEDMITIRMASSMRIMEQANESIANAWERIFRKVELMWGMATREVGAHHDKVLQLTDKIAEQRTAQAEASAKTIELENKQHVAETAIKEASGTVGRLMDAVVSAIGGAGMVSQLRPLLKVVESDPELVALLTDPDVVGAIQSEPELAGMLRGVLAQTKAAAAEIRAAQEAEQRAEGAEAPGTAQQPSEEIQP